MIGFKCWVRIGQFVSLLLRNVPKFACTSSFSLICEVNHFEGGVLDNDRTSLWWKCNKYAIFMDCQFILFWNSSASIFIATAIMEANCQIAKNQVPLSVHRSPQECLNGGPSFPRTFAAFHTNRANCARNKNISFAITRHWCCTCRAWNWPRSRTRVCETSRKKRRIHSPGKQAPLFPLIP